MVNNGEIYNEIFEIIIELNEHYSNNNNFNLSNFKDNMVFHKSYNYKQSK